MWLLVSDWLATPGLGCQGVVPSRAGVQRAESSAPHRDEMGRGGSEVNRGGGVECTGGSGHLNEVLSGRRADTATQSLLKEDLFQSDSLGRNEQHAA